MLFCVTLFNSLSSNHLTGLEGSVIVFLFHMKKQRGIVTFLGSHSY